MNLTARYTSILSLSAAAALLLIPFAAAKDAAKAPDIVRRNCSGCHGMDGNSQLPYFPRLSGLTAAYSERKLLSFRGTPSPAVDATFDAVAKLGRAPKETGITAQASEYMVGISHSTSDYDAKVSAIWYAAQAPGSGKNSNVRLMEEGKQIYMRGNKPQGLIACESCHGADAKGNAFAPRLASQNAGYLVGQLTLFRAGDRRHSPEMTTVAQNVDREQARAVAAYLQSR